MSTPVPRQQTRRWLLLGLGFLAAAGGVLWCWSALAPGSVAAGVAAYRRAEWAAASTLAQKRLAQAGDDPEALRLLARASARLGRHPVAQALYARLDRRALDAEDHFLLGLGLSRAGRYDAAVGAWRSALAADPDHAETLHEMAQYGMLKAHPLEGAQAAERLARQPGWETRGYLLLGMIRAADHDPVGATAALQRALSLNPSARLVDAEPFSTRKLLARTLLQSGRPAEARAVLRTVLDAGPDEEAAWLLSRAWLLEGKEVEARAALTRAGSYRADHPLEPEPSPYVGEARCAACHRQLVPVVLASRHARTYRPGPRLAELPLPDQALPDSGDPQVRHTLRRVDGRLHLETRVQDRVFRAVADYALGSSDRYLSLVGRDDRGQVRVLRLSYYCNLDGAGWGRTKGQAAHPGQPEDYLGKRLLRPDEANECLICHTTVARSARLGTGPESADHAIGCEGCHGPGSVHLAAVSARSPDRAIVNPRHASGAALNQLCGHCHSQHLLEMPSSLTDPAWTRFPGSTLPWSRCYTESGGAVSCLTCHDPHRNAETSPQVYEEKCLACHAASTTEPDQGPEATPEAFRSSCPVNATRGCIPCHMPKLASPTLHTSFTDHYIRVPRREALQARAGTVPPRTKPPER